MRKKYLTALLLVFSVFLGGCSLLPGSSTKVVRTSPTVSVSGVISAVGTVVTITTADGKSIELDTLKQIDFTKYNGKTAKVTGEYSGTVLFVDKIE